MSKLDQRNFLPSEYLNKNKDEINVIINNYTLYFNLLQIHVFFPLKSAEKSRKPKCNFFRYLVSILKFSFEYIFVKIAHSAEIPK